MDGESGADFACATDDADPVNSTERACGMEGMQGTVAVEDAEGVEDVHGEGGVTVMISAHGEDDVFSVQCEDGMDGMDDGNGMCKTDKAKKSKGADEEVRAWHRSLADRSDRAEGTERRTAQ